jgi:hypothetical protein
VKALAVQSLATRSAVREPSGEGDPNDLTDGAGGPRCEGLSTPPARWSSRRPSPGLVLWPASHPPPEHGNICSMTADGSAVIRPQRVLASPGSSALQIRAVAAELPRIGLEDALAIMLALSDREPHTFSRGAARWGARLTLEHRLALDDAQLTLAALATLPGPGARAGAEALIELADRHGLRRVDEQLIAWMRTRGIGD